MADVADRNAATVLHACVICGQGHDIYRSFIPLLLNFGRSLARSDGNEAVRDRMDMFSIQWSAKQGSWTDVVTDAERLTVRCLRNANWGLLPHVCRVLADGAVQSTESGHTLRALTVLEKAARAARIAKAASPAVQVLVVASDMLLSRSEQGAVLLTADTAAGAMGHLTAQEYLQEAVVLDLQQRQLDVTVTLLLIERIPLCFAESYCRSLGIDLLHQIAAAVTAAACSPSEALQLYTALIHAFITFDMLARAIQLALAGAAMRADVPLSVNAAFCAVAAEALDNTEHADLAADLLQTAMRGDASAESVRVLLWHASGRERRTLMQRRRWRCCSARPSRAAAADSAGAVVAGRYTLGTVHTRGLSCYRSVAMRWTRVIPWPARCSELRLAFADAGSHNEVTAVGDCVQLCRRTHGHSVTEEARGGLAALAQQSATAEESVGCCRKRCGALRIFSALVLFTTDHNYLTADCWHSAMAFCDMARAY